MRGYGGIWLDMGGYGANGVRWDPRTHMGPSGRALHWFHIPPLSPHIFFNIWIVHDISYVHAISYI